MKNLLKKSGIENIKLTVAFIKEGKSFIAYSPALDLSTAGKTKAEARKRFEEMMGIFFEDLQSAGNTTGVLNSLGWEKRGGTGGKKWNPPKIVSSEDVAVSIPDPVA